MSYGYDPEQDLANAASGQAAASFQSAEANRRVAGAQEKSALISASALHEAQVAHLSATAAVLVSSGMSVTAAAVKAYEIRLAVESELTRCHCTGHPVFTWDIQANRDICSRCGCTRRRDDTRG
jgi:hypothetical protein